MRDIPLDNLSYSLLLELSNGSKGSGFMVNSNERIFLVTAKHCLFDQNNNLLGNQMTVLGYTNNLEDGDTAEYTVALDRIHNNQLILTNNSDDVAVILLGTRTNGRLTMVPDVQLTRVPNGITVSIGEDTIKLIRDVLIANSVFIQGYPSSVGLRNIPQINFRKPLVRKGIVAGKNETLNTIILDCQVNPGNSGGPVIEVENMGNTVRYKLIGLVSQYVPFVTNINGTTIPQGPTPQQNPQPTILQGFVYNNSGYSVVVPCDPILDLIRAHP